MAAIFPSTAFLPRTIHLGLSGHSRKAIEHQIEALIDLLDQLDGDPDVEEDELHDDPLELGEGDKVFSTLPRYGIDQRTGPVNERQAIERHQRERDMAWAEAASLKVSA